MIFVPNFLSDSECNLLNEWVLIGVKKKWLDFGTNRGSALTYQHRLTTRPYGQRFQYPEIVYEISEKITKFLEIQHLKKSDVGGGRDGIVVSYTLPGGENSIHKDPKEGDFHLLRCNVMTQAADSGGELFVGNKKININVGDLHCYLPSTVEHYVTEVKGQTPRVLWMFGYQCSIERFNKI
jgi:hypothetical protein